MWEVSSTVVISWREKQIIAENYISNTSFEITPDILLIL